jgi:tetratricopeptide (TPR) repeat protein
MKKLLLLLLFIPLVSFGQDYGNDSDALKLCTAIQTNSFISDSKADNALDRILSVIGASKRFVLQPCDNINNAVATSYKGIRYILYDKDFMDSLDSGDNWSNLFILAHEVGHHINGHSLDILLYAAEAVEPETLANQRQQELEADEFAGFILGKLGATLEQTSSSINLISSEKDDTYDTHPSKSKRLASIETGFNKALGKKSVIYETPTKAQTAEEYLYRAIEKNYKVDYYGAISDFTKAIELGIVNVFYVYNNRAFSKSNLEDYKGAMEDYNKSIENYPDYSEAYNNRGLTKSFLKDHNGAINDFTSAIDVNSNFIKDFPEHEEVLSLAYHNRGVSKNDINDYVGAISDFTKAIELNNKFLSAYTNRSLTKEVLGDYNGAIEDNNKAIDIDPNFVDGYFLNGWLKYLLADNYGAVGYFSQAIENNPDLSKAFHGRGMSKFDLGDDDGAISDLNKAIELNPKYYLAYYGRGQVKSFLKDHNGAIADFNKSIEPNPNDADAYLSNGRSKLSLEDWDGARIAFSKYIKANPDDPSGYYNRGLARYMVPRIDFKRDRYMSAINDFTKAIELNPDYASAYYWRGNAKHERNNLIEACSDWKMAVKLGNTEAEKWIASDCN